MFLNIKIRRSPPGILRPPVGIYRQQAGNISLGSGRYIRRKREIYPPQGCYLSLIPPLSRSYLVLIPLLSRSYPFDQTKENKKPERGKEMSGKMSNFAERKQLWV